MDADLDPYLFVGESDIHPIRVPVSSKRKGKIYSLECACHPEHGVRYIGQTRRDPQLRFEEHLEKSRHVPSHWQEVYGWIASHGEVNIFLKIVESAVPIEQLDYHEIFHIVGHRSAGDELLNMDNFWSLNGAGHWEHLYPKFHPFNGEMSRTFLIEEFDRGIYPLTLGEFDYKRHRPGQTTEERLSELLTPEMQEHVTEWRKGRPSVEDVARLERENFVRAALERYVDFPWERASSIARRHAGIKDYWDNS